MVNSIQSAVMQSHAKHQQSAPWLEWLTCSGDGVSFSVTGAGVSVGLSMSSSSGRGSSRLLEGNPLTLLESGGVASSSSIISSVSSSPTPADDVESAGDSCWNQGFDNISSRLFQNQHHGSLLEATVKEMTNYYFC
jgi:hypothetical protein